MWRLRPVFAHDDADHAHHVVVCLGEVFTGPATYPTDHGGYPTMLHRHLGLTITPEQRAHWVQLIAEATDEAGLRTSAARNSTDSAPNTPSRWYGRHDR